MLAHAVTFARDHISLESLESAHRQTSKIPDQLVVAN
jgi:hypothetical protein